MSEPTYSTDEAAELAGVTAKQLRHLVATGRVPGQARRLGSGQRRRWSRQQVEAAAYRISHHHDEPAIAELITAARIWRAALLPNTSTATWPAVKRLAAAVDALEQR